MNRQQALDLIGGLPAVRIRDVWNAASPMAGTDLREGLWLGRNGGMPWPIKRIVRHIVGREWFAKLILPGWGINVRVRQDGSHGLLRSAEVPGGVKVDLPFLLTREGLDYGYHVLGRDMGPTGLGLQMRDYLRGIGLRTLAEVVEVEHLRRVGATRGEGDEESRLVIGYIAPAGLKALMGTPFGMMWERETTASERESAERYARTIRVWDSSRGPAGQGRWA